MRKPLNRPERPEYACELHHVFGGPNRKWSEKYNCVIYLPRQEHTGKNGVHSDACFSRRLHERYQRQLEAAGWTRGEFMETFGRNYL